MDFPGAQELAQRLALEWAALMEELERIQRYIGVIAVVILTAYLSCSVWLRLKHITKAIKLRRSRQMGFQEHNSR